MRAWLAIACLFTLSSVAVAAETSLVYVTPRGVTYTVSEKGLTTIRKGFGAVVDGQWTAFNAESLFKNGGSNTVQVPPPTEQTLTVVSPKQAQVRHVSGDVVCTYDYTFNEEDVIIKCRFENNHASDSINVLGFSGLKFHFARPPEGILPVESSMFLQEQGIAAMHPSSFSPIGGSYAVDKDVGFGVSPWNSSFFRTLLLWDYADWEAGERTRVLERELKYLTHTPVPSGGSVTVGIRIRVSAEMDWKHLLAPYREIFQKLHGPVQYQTDGRWIATENLLAPEASETKRPSTARRFEATRLPDESTTGTTTRVNAKAIDNSRGAQALCDSLIPRLQEATGQGAILWGYGGSTAASSGNPLADFNILSPEIEEQWTRITDQFNAAGLKFGVATNPRGFNVRKGWSEQQMIRLPSDTPEQRELIAQRYEQMVQRDCNLFYLEDFGDSLEDIQLMRWLREKLGKDVQMFADRPCDALLVYSGGYTGTVLKTASSAGLERGYRMTVGEKNWQILQWLAPGCELAGQLTEVKGNLADALEAPERYFLSRHVVPFVPVADFKRLAGMKKIQPQFVADDGKWLATPSP